MGNIRQLQQQGALTFALPGQQQQYTARPYQIEYTDEANYTYRAHIDQDGYPGDLALFAREGEIFGHLRLRGHSYEIQALGPGRSVLLQANPAYAPDRTCGTSSEGAAPQKAEEPTLQARTESTCNRIRILIMYTPAAAQLVDPTQYATAAISDANTILQNSTIGWGILRYELAGVEPWDFVETYNEMNYDRERLRDSPAVEALRLQHEADVVVGLTDAGGYEIWDTTYNNDGTYSIDKVGFYGLSTVDVYNQDDAHALVEVTTPPDEPVFAHEVGHMYGCRHHSDSGGSAKAHGHYFSAGPWGSKRLYNTLMATGRYAERIMYFSNPNMTYEGEALGTHSFNDNTYIVRNYRQYLCSIYPGPSPFSAYISGPTMGNSTTEYTWCAVTEGCSDAVSYSWDYSTDGFTFYGAGSGTCHSQTLPATPNLWLRLTATCPGEPTRTHTLQITNEDACEMCRPEEGNLEDPESQSISIYPNPTRGSFTVNVGGMEEGPYTLKLLDMTGKVLHTQAMEEQQITVNNPGISPGLYIVLIKGPQSTQMLRLIME